MLVVYSRADGNPTGSNVQRINRTGNRRRGFYRLLRFDVSAGKQPQGSYFGGLGGYFSIAFLTMTSSLPSIWVALLFCWLEIPRQTRDRVLGPVPAEIDGRIEFDSDFLRERAKSSYQGQKKQFHQWDNSIERSAVAAT